MSTTQEDVHADLLSALDLKPVKLEPISFGDFLSRLGQHPEWADTAHGLLVRAIEAAGEVNIEAEPIERRPYLRMLKDSGIRLYRAFDHVRGSQLTADKQMQHLRAAAQNGYQLFLAMIIKGPPGSGKSMFVDAFKHALEGQVVYTVDGCSVHENPLNLLKLLSPESIAALADRLDLTGTGGRPSLTDMLSVAGEPCPHCWSKIMENENESDPNRALLQLKVVPMRLSSRKFGISTLTANTTLPEVLEFGSRGLVDMGELFDGAGTPMMNPASPVFKILLEATNDRRIPSGISRAHEAVRGPERSATQTATQGTPPPQPMANLALPSPGYQPLDTVLFGQANEGAWEQFCRSLGKDAGKFTRRFHVVTYPYNTSVTEEELAYRDRIALMREHPHFDPMALKLLALLGVISRLEEDLDDDLDVVLKARIYDGEELEVKRSSSSAGTSEYWTVQDLWREVEREGYSGLDMTVMFNLLSEIIDRALSLPGLERCVSSYELITYLRTRLAELEKSDGFTSEQKEVLARCLDEFLAPAAKKGSKPGTIESEYQRVLQRQMFEVAAPDFERRAAELFERYKRHADAYATGSPTVEEVEQLEGGRTRMRTVEVDVEFLDEVDGWIGLKSSAARDEFRSSLETQIFTYQREQRIRASIKGGGETNTPEVTWNTLPKLADGIRKMLNDDTRQRLERMLKSQLELPDENEDDRRMRAAMFERFDQLGYCHHCVVQAIEYFKLNELWQIQSQN